MSGILGSVQILVLNTGSSSLKAAVVHAESGVTSWHALAERLGDATPCLRWSSGDVPERQIELQPGATHAQAVAELLRRLEADGALSGLAGVGHRVVHGAEEFSGSVRVSDAVLDALRRCSHLAPLHNPANILGIEAALEAFPDLPQVAVFDTAFHQGMPAHSYLYAVPYELYEEHGVRRYGFHGSSHRFVSEEAARRLGRPLADLSLITAHLGNGCSLAAIEGGRSVDSTMGMTPLEGLVMGTRSGDVDPGLHAFLHRQLGLDIDAITNLLNKRSGLLGLSGRSNDMRTLLAAEAEGDERAALAIDVFCYRLARSIGAMTAALPKLDALVFTGGIGEHAAPVRERALSHLSILGFRIDAEANEIHGGPSGRITADDSRCALVIPTDEERVIAQDTAVIAAAEARS